MPSLTRFEFDAAYVARLVAGDAEIERHFTEYFGDLLALKLRSRLRSPTLVEDAKQETFVRVLTTLRRNGGLASAPSLGAFVNTVCTNVLFETYRSQTKARAATSDAFDTLASATEDAETRLVGQGEQRRVREAIRLLPDKDQELLRWLFFDEAPKDEICQRLGIDRNYLRVMVHRVKARFREAFDKSSGGPSHHETRGPVATP